VKKHTRYILCWCSKPDSSTPVSTLRHEAMATLYELFILLRITDWSTWLCVRIPLACIVGRYYPLQLSKWHLHIWRRRETWLRLWPLNVMWSKTQAPIKYRKHHKVLVW